VVLSYSAGRIKALDVMRPDPLTAARWACIYAGLMFGIFWIPLRELEDAGFAGPWSTLMLCAVPLTLLLPVLWRRWRAVLAGHRRFHAASFLLGASFVLYANGFIYTTVVRTFVLFYLMPVWGFLLARLVIGDAITPVRGVSVIVALAGLLTIFGAEAGVPLPRNAGDWMAIISGFTWALASLMLLMDTESKAVDYGVGFFLYATAVAAAMGTGLFLADGPAPPGGDALLQALPWFVPVAALLILPAGFATVFGPMLLNPGTVGLLFMAEIAVGTVTAALWAGEPFGIRELLGVLLIAVAGLLEPVQGLLHRQRAPVR
jgi:drug/metabolite transporter (DMT)-like permease